MPAVAGAEKPAEAAALTNAEPCCRSRRRRTATRWGHVPEREEEGQGEQDHEERGRAHTEDRPVEGHSVVGLDLADRAQRGDGGEGHRDDGGEQRPEQDRPTQTDHAVEDRVGRIGAQRAEDLAIDGQPAHQPDDGLGGDQQHRYPGDQPEQAEGERFGLDRLLRLFLDDRGHVVVRQAAEGKVLGVGVEEGLHTGRRPGQLDAGPGVAHAARGQPISQGRSGHHPGYPVDVVLHHLVIEDADADDVERHPLVRAAVGIPAPSSCLFVKIPSWIRSPTWSPVTLAANFERTTSSGLSGWSIRPATMVILS